MPKVREVGVVTVPGCLANISTSKFHRNLCGKDMSGARNLWQMKTRPSTKRKSATKTARKQIANVKILKYCELWHLWYMTVSWLQERLILIPAFFVDLSIKMSASKARASGQWQQALPPVAASPMWRTAAGRSRHESRFATELRASAASAPPSAHRRHKALHPCNRTARPKTWKIRVARPEIKTSEW